MTTTEHLLHKSVPGERWDTIAYKYYANGELSHVLIEANRHHFTDSLAPPWPVIPAGTLIRVPIMEAEKVNPDNLPPWRR